jgi:hypothetical protein
MQVVLLGELAVSDDGLAIKAVTQGCIDYSSCCFNQTRTDDCEGSVDHH